MRSQNKILEILSPEVLAKIDNYHFVAKIVVEGLMAGMHRSIYHGFGSEFLQYRNYSHGDEYRNIDWKVYARLDRLFTKVFQEETNFNCTLILDSSSSMAYKGNSSPCSKFHYAAMTASSIAYLAGRQGDNVGLFSYADTIRSFVKHGTRRGQIARIINELIATIPEGKAAHLQNLKTIAKSIRKRGIIIFITDFLDTDVDIHEILKTLKISRNEIIVIQILDRDELEFDFQGAVRFIDSESENSILTAPANVRKEYLSAMNAHLEKIKNACRDIQADYMLVKTSDNLGLVLAEYLQKRGSAV